MKIRPATQDNLIQCDNAIAYLKRARDWAKGADCPKLTDAICRAIKSAGGARRHLKHRLAR